MESANELGRASSFKGRGSRVTAAARAFKKQKKLINGGETYTSGLHSVAGS